MSPNEEQKALEIAADLTLEGKPAAAREVYEKLVRQGSWYAEVQLGYMLMTGVGGEKDILRAETLFQSSADHGSQLGKYYLGATCKIAAACGIFRPE